MGVYTVIPGTHLDVLRDLVKCSRRQAAAYGWGGAGMPYGMGYGRTREWYCNERLLIS